MTEEGLDVIVEEYISTHILTKRMTPFNSVPLYWKKISTHILTKRMTTEVFLERSDSLHFNSHPHEEDDSGQDSLKYSPRYFNSHPHEEDDDNNRRREERKKDFNSHPHEEDDLT